MTDTLILGNSLYTNVDGSTWEEAEANSVKLGGHLVTINNATENTWLHDVFKITPKPDSIANPLREPTWLWTGFNDLRIEGQWEWVSGEPVTYTNWWDSAWTDILPPPAPNPRENYMHLGFIPPDKWNDTSSNGDIQNRGGIAETPIVIRGDSAYAIVQGPTWEEAEANAQKLGGHLVTINDAEENSWIASQFGSMNWIGINDLYQGGDYIWSSGEPVTYTNWYPGEPNDPGHSQDYGWLMQGGVWDDLENNPFVTQGIAEIKLENSAPTIYLDLDNYANTVDINGQNSGVINGTPFSSIQSIDLKGGNDKATIGIDGSLSGLLNGGSGTDELILNDGDNTFKLNGDGIGTANGTGTVTEDQTKISSFELVHLLGGDDKATIDLLKTSFAPRSLVLDGGQGNDSVDIILSDEGFGVLRDTGALAYLGEYLSSPTGKALDIAFGDFTLSASGFESATFNHVIPTDDQPPEAPTLTSVAASASDTASVSGLEGLNLDVGGAANVQAPVTLKSTSDAITVEGNVKSDAHATEVRGISTSTLHTASDLSVGSALQSIVSGSAESTSGIAIANALVDIQHGIDLTDTATLDALASGGSSMVTSTSNLTATSTVQTVGDGSSDSGYLRLDGAWANTIAEDHLGLGSTGTLTLDSDSDATVSTSMVSNLSSTATANDGLAVATAELLSSTGIENLNAEVGGLGLVTAINQGVFKADATSTTDDASAMGINKASAGILDSTFSFGITDSTITAKDLNSLQVSATSTGGDAWSKLQSSSTGIADLNGIENRITDAGSISAIASDQGFANSATVSGSSSAFASQEAIGMSGYEVHNHSDLMLTAQALVISESNSSAVGG